MPNFCSEQDAPFWFPRKEFTSPLGCSGWKRQVLQTSIQLTHGDGASWVPGSRGIQLQTCLQLKQTCGETHSLTQPDKVSSWKLKGERLSHSGDRVKAGRCVFINKQPHFSVGRSSYPPPYKCKGQESVQLNLKKTPSTTLPPPIIKTHDFSSLKNAAFWLCLYPYCTQKLKPISCSSTGLPKRLVYLPTSIHPPPLSFRFPSSITRKGS